MNAMDSIKFYQPPNLMNTSKLHSPNLPPASAQSQFSGPPAQRPIHTTHRSSSLSHPSQQLRHPLPPRPSSFDHSPISSEPPCSRSPGSSPNDFDRILEEVWSDDGNQSLDGNNANVDDHVTIPTGSNPCKSSDDRLNSPVTVNTVTESVSEAGCLDAIQPGASKENPIDVDSMEICLDDELAKSEPVDAQTPPRLLYATEVSTDKDNEPEQRAGGGAALTSREVSETPSLIMREPASPGVPHTSVSPRPPSRPRSIPVEQGCATRVEWPVRRILNSRIRTRGGKAILEYCVAWKPTWQTRDDLVPGCEELVKEFHAEWKNKRPSLTTLAGHRHFKQKRKSPKGGRRKRQATG